MYFITRPWFCQHLFAIIFILFDRTRFLRVCTAFFTGFFPRSSPRFLPAACTAGLRSGIFVLFLLCGHPAADALRPQGLRTFPAKSRSKRKTSIFMIFLVSLLSFLCYNSLTICFNLCPCRGTGALRRASIGRRAAGFSLQRDTTEGRSYETGKRGNS